MEISNVDNVSSGSAKNEAQGGISPQVAAKRTKFWNILKNRWVWNILKNRWVRTENPVDSGGGYDAEEVTYDNLLPVEPSTRVSPQELQMPELSREVLVRTDTRVPSTPPGESAQAPDQSQEGPPGPEGDFWDPSAPVAHSEPQGFMYHYHHEIVKRHFIEVPDAAAVPLPADVDKDRAYGKYKDHLSL